MNTLNQERKQFFNERAANWLDTHYKAPGSERYDLHANQINAIVSNLALTPDCQVLDTGCGSGVLVPYLLSHLGPEGRLIEMDFAGQMILENQARYPDPRINFVCCDAARMEIPPASLDAIICFAAFPHFSDPQEVLHRMAKSLKPHGRLVIAHLMSSTELASHHNSHTPVCHDRLPEKEIMHEWVMASGLEITHFEDRSGRYLLVAAKP